MSIDDLNKQGTKIESKQWGRKITDLNNWITKYGTFQGETKQLNKLIIKAGEKKEIKTKINKIPGEKVQKEVIKLQSKMTT